MELRYAPQPSPLIIGTVFTLAYLGDLYLTFLGSRFVMTFREVGIMAPAINNDHWILASLAKSLGLVLVWYFLYNVPLDTYQVVMLHANA